MESNTVKDNFTMSFSFVTDGWKGAEVNEDTFMEEVETYTTFKVATFITTYWFPVLIPIGLVGNTLSFLVMIKPNNTRMSTCIYMAAISINDNIMMCICFHDYLVSVVQIHRCNPIQCKFVAYFCLFALQNCTFHVVAIEFFTIGVPVRLSDRSSHREELKKNCQKLPPQ